VDLTFKHYNGIGRKVGGVKGVIRNLDRHHPCAIPPVLARTFFSTLAQPPPQVRTEPQPVHVAMQMEIVN
jgi:hypothetical protein